MAATAGRRRRLFPSSLENAWIITLLYILIASCGYCQAKKSSAPANIIDYSSNCRDIFTDVRFNRSEIPVSPISEKDAGELCPKGITCCTKEMESKLTLLAMKEYQDLMDKAIEPIQSTFTSRTSKFDEFFRKLLKKSYNELHMMFVTTYGLLYQRNSRLFLELYTNLNDYYKGRDIDLEKALRSFFINLLKKMFELLNLAFKPDGPYLDCVGSKMDKFKPFEDIPKKLAAQVKRAFIAARTFVQGLTIGRDFINAISKLNPSKECIRSVASMLYCPVCQGKRAQKPCTDYCFKTIQACQPYDKELNDVWNQYIDALKMLARRLDGPFNIEAVVDPMNVKISDAIMTYQSKADFVSAKVFTECGHPSIKNKRDTSDMNFQKYDYEWPSAKKNYVRPTVVAGTSLDRLVRDINEKVKISTDYWINIPRFVCRDEKLAVEGAVDVDLDEQLYNNTDFIVNPTADCWNPKILASDENDMQKDDMGHYSDPEADRTHTIVLQQVSQLKSMTAKLHSAYNGVYVESIPDFDGSGDSTSSSGANDNEDDEDYSGSGGSGYSAGNDERKPGSTASENDFFVTESTPVPTRQYPDNRGQSSAARLLRPFALCISLIVACLLIV